MACDVSFIIFRYYALRKKVDNTAVYNFFITNTGNPVTKIFDLINAECKSRDIRLPKIDGTPGEVLKISATLIRKQIETAGSNHESNVMATLATTLQHSEETARRYYHVQTKNKAIDNINAVKLVETTAKMEEYILKK
ncbi:MAG: hypothetical protein ACRYE7_01535 [Janthinobacterium lividum]